MVEIIQIIQFLFNYSNFGCSVWHRQSIMEFFFEPQRREEKRDGGVFSSEINLSLGSCIVANDSLCLREIKDCFLPITASFPDTIIFNAIVVQRDGWSVTMLKRCGTCRMYRIAAKLGYESPRTRIIRPETMAATKSSRKAALEDTIFVWNWNSTGTDLTAPWLALEKFPKSEDLSLLSFLFEKS